MDETKFCLECGYNLSMNWSTNHCTRCEGNALSEAQATIVRLGAGRKEFESAAIAEAELIYKEEVEKRQRLEVEQSQIKERLTVLLKSCAPQCEPEENIISLYWQIDNCVAGQKQVIAQLEAEKAVMREVLAKELHAELNTMKWIGSDAGWDIAIEAVRTFLVSFASTSTDYATQRVGKLNDMTVIIQVTGGSSDIDRALAADGLIDTLRNKPVTANYTIVDFNKYAYLKVSKTLLPEGASLVEAYDDGKDVVISDEQYAGEWVAVQREDLKWALCYCPFHYSSGKNDDHYGRLEAALEKKEECLHHEPAEDGKMSICMLCGAGVNWRPGQDLVAVRRDMAERALGCMQSYPKFHDWPDYSEPREHFQKVLEKKDAHNG